MPDMIYERLTIVEFTTTSDDFIGTILGPAGESEQQRPIANGASLPRDQPGHYTLKVRDRQLRALTVTLTDKGSEPRSQPPTYTKTDDETVIVSFQVF